MGSSNESKNGNGKHEAERPAGKTTKRSVLARISQVYDPIGMAAPVTIVSRIFFRNLTKNGQAWDDQLNEQDKERWIKWQNELLQLETSSIPRWLGLRSKKGNERYQLHAFCDASTDAYAAGVYIRTVTECSQEKAKRANVAFVLGKARVATPKVVTVPRLELSAAKLAAELVHTVQEELEINVESRTLWSDSQTVIKYINNVTRRFHVFVANRVEAILNRTEAKEWRYVPTHLNPADNATRGLDASNLNNSSWLRGPDFLIEQETEWPRCETPSNVAEDDPEVKIVKESAHWTQGEEKEPCFVEQLAERYSVAAKFRRALAVWLRVKCKLQKKPSLQGPFTATELMQAERAGIKWLQRDHWGLEMEKICLNQRPPVWLRKLTPIIRDDMLWMQARTGIDLLVIPDGSVARLLVIEAHEMEGHMGKQATAASTRRGYWIIHLSKIVRKVIRQCPSCQRRRATLGKTQMAALPDLRIVPGPPFQTTGIDYFGPFIVRHPNSEGCTKAYGIIFTCAVSRAIHLEVADSLDISSFINALRRFCARRGSVQTLISDNASNLSGACEALRKEVNKAVKAHRNNPRVLKSLREKNIDWQFTPPTASHFGGFYERLIRCVRGVLTALLEPGGRRQVLTQDSLMTFLCECECILNNRPLTTVSNDPNDLDALTPNHLLLGRSNASFSLPGNYNDLSVVLRSRWKLVQHMVRVFWQRWNKEYKTLLYTRQKWFESIKRPFRVNDVVLLKDSTKSSTSLGLLGRIIGVHPSLDTRAGRTSPKLNDSIIHDYELY